MMDAAGRGLTVLEILARIRALDGGHVAECQEHEAAGMGSGVQWALSKGWVEARDVSEARQLRENTKRFVIALYHQLKGNRAGGSDAHQGHSSAPPLEGAPAGGGGRMSRFGLRLEAAAGGSWSLGEGLEAMDLPVDAEVGEVGEAWSWVQEVEGRQFSAGDVANRQMHDWLRTHQPKTGLNAFALGCAPGAQAAAALNGTVGGFPPETCPVTQVAGVPEQVKMMDMASYLEEVPDVEERYFDKSLSAHKRIEALWREGWDVEWLFGAAAGRLLREKFAYYPMLGTGVGLEVRMEFDTVQIVRIHSDSPCVGQVRVGDYVLQIDDFEVNSESDFQLRVAGEPGSMARLLVLPYEQYALIATEGVAEDALLEVAVPRLPFREEMLREYEAFQRDRMFIS